MKTSIQADINPPTYSLSDAVHTLLVRADATLAAKWRGLYAEPMDQSISNQLICVNRFWRDQLAGLPVSTFGERECLIDNINVDDWLRLFQTHVVATIVRHNLPVQRQVVENPENGQPSWLEILTWGVPHAG